MNKINMSFLLGCLNSKKLHVNFFVVEIEKKANIGSMLTFGRNFSSFFAETILDHIFF